MNQVARMSAAALLALCVAAAPLVACVLPADPYVVVRISEKAVDDVASPDDLKPLDDYPGVTDPTTGQPAKRVKLDEDHPYHILALWDLTQGGAVPDPFAALPADFADDARAVSLRYSVDSEVLLPVNYYFNSGIAGKVEFKLAELISRGNRSYEDPMAAVDIGGYVKDGDYKLNGGEDIYAWNDSDFTRDNEPFPLTLDSNRFPKTAAYNNGQQMTRQGAATASGNATEWRVTEARYLAQGKWVLKSYSSSYNMDEEGLGGNPGVVIEPPANDPQVQNGDYEFTYITPSDPYAYHIVVGSALIFELQDIVWRYKEELYEEIIERDDDGNIVSRTWQKCTSESPNEIESDIHVEGKLARSTQGLSQEVRVGSVYAAVVDRTNPTHVHISPGELAATTGETLAGGGNGATVQVEVIDNNPFAALGTAGMEFDPANMRVDLYYSTEVYDYQSPGDGGLPVDLGITPRFVWAKVKPGGISRTVQAFNRTGTQVTPGPGSDAVYSIATYQVPIANFEEPMGWHFVHADGTGPNPLKVLAIGYDGVARASSIPVPEVAADSSGRADQDPHAALSIAAGSFFFDPDSGQEIPASFGAGPTFTYPASHAGCPTDRIGAYASINVTDNDRPIVYLRVTDTKYNRQTLFGNRFAGELSWEKARTTGFTNSNIAPDGQAPWSDPSSVWEFSQVYGDSETGYMDQYHAQTATPPAYSPSTYTSPGEMYGYWVDEDVPLVFEVYARDNIHWGDATQPAGGSYGITTHLSGNPPDNWRIFDVPTYGGTGEVDSPPWPQFIFRNPNRPSPHSGECKVEIEVSDAASLTGGMTNSRRLIVHFFIQDNRLKIQSLEEDRERGTIE